jgi:general secretion pathway protein C
MKRMPLLMTLLALIVLSVSSAYWAMQLYKPAQRPLAAAPAAAMPDPAIDAAATLFGGQQVAASNYQLTGVVAAGSADSAAIIVVDNGTPLTLKVGKEIVSGLRVQQVFPRYVVLSDGRRIDMAQETRPANGQPANAGAQQAQMQQQQMQQQQQQMQQPQAAPIQVPGQPATVTPGQNNPQPQNVPPPPAPMQMAPPVRSVPTTPGMTGQPVMQ